MSAITWDVRNPQSLGEIAHWPGGYAMSLGRDYQGVVRCCGGHATTEEAKTHGLVRLGEIASRVADLDIAAWVERADAS